MHRRSATDGRVFRYEQKMENWVWMLRKRDFAEALGCTSIVSEFSFLLYFHLVWGEECVKNGLGWGTQRHNRRISRHRSFLSISAAPQQSLGPRSLTWWPFPNTKCQARMKNLIKFLCVHSRCWCSPKKSRTPFAENRFELRENWLKLSAPLNNEKSRPLPFRFKDG